MKIHGMALLRNEANENRWLSDFITQMRLICDRMVILDDCSTDDTYSMCKLYECEMYKTEKQLWETNEVQARRLLFNYTINGADNNDWIICLDGDELLELEHIAYINWVMKHYNNYGIDSIGFKLFDMWNEKQYRDDKYWTAHFRYWPMTIKYYKGFNYEWSDKALHCGRFPLNSCKKMLPTNIPIRHMGWSTEALRMKKYDRYMKIDGEGKNGILEQYYSILDKNPVLREFK